MTLEIKGSWHEDDAPVKDIDFADYHQKDEQPYRQWDYGLGKQDGYEAGCHHTHTHDHDPSYYEANKGNISDAKVGAEEKSQGKHNAIDDPRQSPGIVPL